jgi:hypothetical protein
MVSPTQTIKFNQLFRIYAGAAEVITQAGFEAYIERIRHEFGWSDNDATFLALRGQLFGQWGLLLRYADTRQDGVIDREEYHTFMGAMVMQMVATGDYSDLDNTARQWIALLDRDRDGKVGVPEYQRFLNIDGYHDVDAREVVAYLDRDGDGLLTEIEIVEAHREFFIATDPFARGNYLFGQPVFDAAVRVRTRAPGMASLFGNTKFTMRRHSMKVKPTWRSLRTM